MESIKVKEIKDDAVMNIQVNKSFYMMCKAALLVAFRDSHSIEKGNAEDFIKSVTTKPYNELNDQERLFHTLSLIVAEIERQADITDQLVEKDVKASDLKSSKD